MGYSDDDFEKASKVNSNSQLYKQAGNAITLNHLVALFSQMGVGGTIWNDRNVEEREKLVEQKRNYC